jgi:predicted acetyltransferase
MSPEFEYGVLPKEEIETLAGIVSESFAFPLERALKIMGEFAPDVSRVVRTDGRVVGGLWLVEMGQWFGGRSVPMTGVSAVGVSPEVRGTGAALALMRAAMAELHERKVALSALYPATQVLYRKAGYEQAGSRFWLEIDPRRIHVTDRALPMRPMVPEDLEAVRGVQREYARRFNGHLDRNDYMWKRMLEPIDRPLKPYVVTDDGRLVGYIFVGQEKLSDGYKLHVADQASISPGAGRRLLTFLNDTRSLARVARMNSAPGDPLLALLPEQDYRLTLGNFWMLRITHLPAALEGRGYAEPLTGELHLEVRDEVVAGNAGRWVLAVEGGRGRVRSGGEGRLAMDVRGLASLYSGYLSPEGATAAGLLEGDPEEVRRAAGFFAGPAPWMPDMF